jgi:hypothetical protein
VLDPARAINRSILLLKQEYSPVYPLFGSNSIFFGLLSTGLGFAHFLIIRSSLLLLSRSTPSHLASRLPFSLLVLADSNILASLKHLNKPKVARPPSQLWSWEGGEVREPVLPTRGGSNTGGPDLVVLVSGWLGVPILRRPVRCAHY